MGAPYNNVPSKLERAIVAYLITQGAGTITDVFPSRAVAARDFPNTTVIPVRGVPVALFTGNYTFTVHILIAGSATLPTGESNPDTAWVQFEQRVAATNDAMMMSTDGQTLFATAAAITAAGRALATGGTTQQQANNKDMADFTCLQVVDGGYGNGDARSAGCDWLEVITFNIDACGSAIN